MINFFEQPVSPTSAENSPEQKPNSDMQTIQSIVDQIQKLCTENENTQVLFESADNWSMSLKQHLLQAQAYLDNENVEQYRKEMLISGMLRRIQAIAEALKTETKQGKNAKVQPIKEAKEELSRFYTKTVES